MAVLDSSFLIDVEHQRPKALQRLKALVDEGVPLRVPAASWIEYLARLEPSKRQRARTFLESATVFEPLGRDIADEAVRLQAELAQLGHPLGWHDLQLAAAASYLHEPLVSNDQAFRGVPGLELLAH